MLRARQILKGRISSRGSMKGKLNNATRYVYPELEPLHITPSGEKQHFKSAKYGYGEVEVDAVESEVLEIIPTTQDQVYEGLFKKVTVPGDSDLAPENIAKDKEVFGVKGTGKIADFKIKDISLLFYDGARADYMYEILALCENATGGQYAFHNNDNITEIVLTDENTDLRGVTDLYCFISNNNNLTKVDLRRVTLGKITTLRNAIYGNNNLTELYVGNLDTSEATDANYGFATNAYEQLDLSGLDFGKIINISYAFANMRTLVLFKSFRNLGKGYTQQTNNYGNYTLDFNRSTKLTHDSIIDIITNGLYDLNLTYDVANGGTLYTQTFKLGSTNLAKLEATEEGLAAIAEANLKGWTVS